MRYLILFLLFSTPFFAQKPDDVIVKKGDKYWEDQLYVSITYNSLTKQPSKVAPTGFSYGAALGYIKDIPFSRVGKWAGGIGVGYSFDSFNHGMHFNTNEFITYANGTNDKLRLHSIEFPIQLRWRNSDAIKYAFWRAYIGTRLSYNFSNSFSSDINSFDNLPVYNKFQTGLELSLGYNSLNFYVYYGLTSIFKDATIEDLPIDTKIAKFGLIFYIL